MQQRQSEQPETMSEIVRDLSVGLKEIIQGEMHLAKAEIKEATDQLKSHFRQVITFGIIAVLSVPPFIAFLVIGLGNLLDGRYWLSALIVSVVFAGIGVPMVMRAITKIKRTDVSLPLTNRAANRELKVVVDKVQDIKSVTKYGRAA